MIEHFGLDKECILPLPQMAHTHDIELRVKWLLNNKDDIRLKLMDALPNVIRLARENFTPFGNVIRGIRQGN